MCGIAGAFHPKATACSDEVMAAMRDRMAHRGPDGVGHLALAGRALRARPPAPVDHRPVERRQPADGQRAPARVARRLQRRDLQPRRVRRELEALGKYTLDHRPLRHRGAAARLRGVGPRVRQALLRHVRRRHLRRARPRPAGAAPDARPRRHQAALLREDRARRVAVRLGDPRAAGAPGPVAGDGSGRLLALPHLHRDAGAADVVPGIFKLPAGYTHDDRPHRPGDARSSGGTASRTRRRTLTDGGPQRGRRGGRADAPAQAVDRAAHGVGRALRRAAVRRRRFSA